MKKEDIKKLYKKKIEEFNYNNFQYYEKSNPKISDAEFDKLKKNIIELETEIFSSDVESGIISLTDFDLSDDSNTSDFASGLLSSYNDVFQSIAAYQFGPARFRQRGYDSRNNKILMNGD